MKPNLFWIWIIQGMCCFGVGKMANFWGSHGKHCLTHLKDEERCQWEEEEGKKINLLCRAALAKRGNRGPGVGQQGHGIGLTQQELLIMEWDTDTQGSAWDGGISLLPPFFHEHLGKGCGEGDQKETGGGRCIRRGMCGWGRQARKHWEMGAEWLCCARGTKVSHFPPKLPPSTPFTALNHQWFPSNWPFPSTCFKPTDIYSALPSPPPPAARGSCSNCCGSGDTDGKVSLSETESPAGLFSHRNVYHQIPPVFDFCTEVQ